jgi:ABC-type multidrug transport system fused ATPase/permease subunit
MALVPQEHFLYRGTIRDNLCLGLARSVTDAELKEACKAAAIYDFVASLPDGE